MSLSRNGLKTPLFEYPPKELCAPAVWRPFVQEGTTANPVIYWLDVQALLPETSAAVFGWKTSRDPHQLDDAVFGDTTVFNGPLFGPAPVYWAPMVYPASTPSHPAGESMDLAFVITSIPEPGSLMLVIMAVLSLAMGGRRRQA